MRIEDILKLSSSIPLSKNVVVNILYISGLINGELNQLLKPKGISIQQFNVLRILRGQKGNPATLSDIQERMINKMSNTTRLVDKLIKKGLVKKQINSTNKRKIDIKITTEGLNFLSQIDKLIDSKEVEIVSQLTDKEASELIRLLSKLRLIAD
ncbi:MarR family winged helix-turn-helix transcriptional regulator [Hyunsoonleella ulvae]|uniref:MarR family winged helix-turn-helix transcriptional regulator n=1 Tax=Hyunsoonleella ulvae TaxID=2799948 RepID=UPI00193A9965|nr:MarR family transcriptional regulator [Hyunsoonleella ulvae]